MGGLFGLNDMIESCLFYYQQITHKRPDNRFVPFDNDFSNFGNTFFRPDNNKSAVSDRVGAMLVA